MKIVALLAALVLGFVATGCSRDDETATETAATTTVETTPAVAGAETIPEPTLVGTLDQGYKIDADGVQIVPAPEELPAIPGSIQAWWYHTEKAYVVLYAGLSLDEYGPLCPGTSILVGPEFEYVSNAPTAPGACAGRLRKNPAGKRAGVRACGPLLLYLTKIPWGTQGVAHASLETVQDGVLLGVSSAIDTTVAEAPEIKLSTAGYTIPAGALPDGSTQVAC
jgi:hypothetical protein